MWTDDPVRDFERHSWQQEAWLESRPQCDYCGEHIQDDSALYLNNEWICDECVKHYTRFIED